jgi:hypothetical protein
VRAITQAEAVRMRAAPKTIASFDNPAAANDGGQAAARLARETLEEIGLFLEKDANAVEPRGGA